MTSAPSAHRGQPALRVHGLRIELLDGAGIVRGVDLVCQPGEIVALVGESGSGKTSIAMALLGYARPGSRIRAGEVWVGDVDMLSLSSPAQRRQRGRRIAYVPQDPAAALNPSQRIGDQIEEIREAQGISRRERDRNLKELLGLVQLPATDEFKRRYPHQLSGGQQQRVMIAMALACRPGFLVLDEPTTGLDVTTQAHVLATIDTIRRQTSVGIVYVTHDLAVVGELADRIAVVYAGLVSESGSRQTIFDRPAHPYTRSLIRAIPRADHRVVLRGIPGQAASPADWPSGCPFSPRCPLRIAECDAQMPDLAHLGDGHDVRCIRARAATAISLEVKPDIRVSPAADSSPEQTPLLELRSIRATHGRRGEIVGVSGVSFAVGRDECVAVVGESGSGKTTLARCIAGLHVPAGGELFFAGNELAGRARDRPSEVRRQIQIIFQNPGASLNPRQTVAEIIERPLAQFFPMRRIARRERRDALLGLVRLHTRLAQRYPRELSGGEQQRVAIARALAAEPSLIICDEITSALDVSVQAAILDLLASLRQRLQTALLFITHDLAVVRSVADRIIVMRGGDLVESGNAERTFRAPREQYTRELLNATPSLGERPIRASTYPAPDRMLVDERQAKGMGAQQNSTQEPTGRVGGFRNDGH